MTSVIEQSCSCELLVLPRRGVYNLSSFLAGDNPATLARKLLHTGTEPIYVGGRYGSDVLTCNWRKEIEGPYGSYHINVKPSNDLTGELIDYTTKISPGDLVFLFMDNQKIWSDDTLLSGKLITIGIIDRVSSPVVVDSEGVEHVSVNISGRDFGAIFTDTTTVFDQAFSVVEQQFLTDAYFQQLADKQSSGQSPLENVLQIINLIYNSKATSSTLVNAQWRLHAHSGDTEQQIPLISLLDITTFTQTFMFGYTLPDPFGFAQAGNVWALMDSFCNRVINEMFVDIRDASTAELNYIRQAGEVARSFLSDADQSKQVQARTDVATSGVFKVLQTSTPSGNQANADGSVPVGQPSLSLVMRQRPYDRDAFMALPQSVVTSHEIYDRDLGFSSSNVVNFFRIRTPILSPAVQELIYGIRVNVDSIFRFGLRRLEPETRYFFSSSDLSTAYANGESQGLDFTDIFDFYIGLLSTWYAANEQLLEGTITTRLRPDIRVGTRLRLLAPNAFTDDDETLFRYGLGDSAYLDFYVQGVSHNFNTSPGASRSTFTVIRGIYPDGQNLAANLRWSRLGSIIPPDLNTFGRFTEEGVFTPESDIAEKIFNDLRRDQ